MRKIKNFVRNVFAHETLGHEGPLEARAPERTRQLAATLFQRESLPEDPVAPSGRRGRGALGALFAPEVLPEDPPEPARRARPGIMHALFAPEALPEDPPLRRPPGRGLVRAAFAPEPLAELAVAAPRPRRSAWLRWLFRFERLDPP